MVAGEIMAGLGAFKTMFDLAKGMKDANDAATRNAVAIELQEKILAAQAQQMTLVERVSELEKEMARLETWDTEKRRYKLTQLAPGGAYAYLLKKSEACGEPGHALCATCYERHAKSILQGNGEMAMMKQALVCPSCKAKVPTAGYEWPEYAE